MPTLSLILLLVDSGLASQGVFKIPGCRNTFLMEKIACETFLSLDLVRSPSLLSGQAPSTFFNSMVNSNVSYDITISSFLVLCYI